MNKHFRIVMLAQTGSAKDPYLAIPEPHDAE